MIKRMLLVAIIFFISIPCSARDFMVDLVEENYKETRVPFSNDPMIYHSIQVISQAGPKLLILKGENPHYRRWIRQYMAADKQFIVQVPEGETDRFLKTKAFEMDIRMIHPFNKTKWPEQRVPERPPAFAMGDQNILIVDADEKRTGLVSSIVQRMGYQAVVAASGPLAVKIFGLEPDKYRMIITTHDLAGFDAQAVVDQFLTINPDIPVLIETGYQKPLIKNRYLARYSETNSVIIKPVLLDDLSDSIQSLLGEKA